MPVPSFYGYYQSHLARVLHTSPDRGVNSRGFTIVELLIVIVVIAILATISTVSYSGIQVRACDSRCASDIVSILKSLEAYKALNGYYPIATPQNPGSFERITDPQGAFMEYLTPQFLSHMPVDPINDATYYHLRAWP